SKLRGVWLLPRRNSHPLVAPAFLWTRNYLIRPRQQRRRDRQAEDLRGLFVLPFALRLLGDLAVGGGGVEAFRTSSTTSCHQCSAGALSSPSSRWRVSANCGSWCHASQFARLLHVPTITLLSGLSAGRRSCPPTQPDRFLAADRRVRMAASQSRPAPSFRCTCVTIVIIGGSPYTSRDALGLTLLPDPPAPAAPAASSGPGLRGLEVDHQLERRGLLDGEIGGPPPQEVRRLIPRAASEPSPSAETMGSSTTICPDCLVTRPKSPA